MKQSEFYAQKMFDCFFSIFVDGKTLVKYLKKTVQYK